MFQPSFFKSQSYKHINDNYFVGPTPLYVKSVLLDPKFQNKVFSKTQTLKSSFAKTVLNPGVSKTLNPVSPLTVNLDVSYPVVDHAPIVFSHGPPQKKD